MVFDREHCLDKFRYETLRKKKKKHLGLGNFNIDVSWERILYFVFLFEEKNMKKMCR